MRTLVCGVFLLCIAHLVTNLAPGIKGDNITIWLSMVVNIYYIVNVLWWEVWRAGHGDPGDGAIGTRNQGEGTTGALGRVGLRGEVDHLFSIVVRGGGDS
jgi:hypothetical protein